MAANNRNKLDEYHLKILRELLTHPVNKYCFDCHQRGPTYVNVTIGSFVCTTCSGILRGLTPPHRVKSITMATFTPEEIEIMQSRGNQYCKNVWLGLYDSEIPTADEQQIKDFMMAKYEKKRYYVDPSTVTTHCALNSTNGSRTPSSLSSTSSSSHNSPSNQSCSDSSTKLQSIIRTQQSSKSNSVTSNGSSRVFTPNFVSPIVSSSQSSIVDPFSSSEMESSSCSDTSFANFDNNPTFDASKSTGISTDHASNLNKNRNEPNVPPEDKYAALKDLDFQMKNQMLEKQQEEHKQKLVANGDWNANTNGLNWTALFPNNSGFSSEPSTPFNPNPFSGEINIWRSSANGTVNPFTSVTKDPWNNNLNWPNMKTQLQQNSSNGWSKDANPFDRGIGTHSNGQSNNPFL